MHKRLAVGMVLLLLGHPATAAPPVDWIMASVTPDGSPSAIMLESIATAFTRTTGGRVRIKSRLGGILGDELTTLELCRQGRIQIWAGSATAIEPSVPGMAALAIPYLFEDMASYQRAMTPRVYAGRLVSKAFADLGLCPLTGCFIGWRGISTRRAPVRRPADLRGLRARTLPAAPLHTRLWRLLGARPTEIALNDLAIAFREKQVDVIDIPPLFLFASSIADQLKHHTQTRHAMQTGLVVINREAFSKLPKKVQADLLRQSPEWSSRGTAVHEKLENELLEALKAQGVNLINLTADEMAGWKSALLPMRAEAARIGGPVGAELLGAIEASR